MLKDVRKVSIDLALSQLSDFPPGTALLMRCNVTVRTLLTKEFLIHGPHGDRTMATHEGTREQLQMAIKIQITGELIIIRTAHRTTSMLVESMVLAQLAREPSYCWILRSLDCPDSMNFFGLQSTEKKKTCLSLRHSREKQNWQPSQESQFGNLDHPPRMETTNKNWIQLGVIWFWHISTLPMPMISLITIWTSSPFGKDRSSLSNQKHESTKFSLSILAG